MKDKRIKDRIRALEKEISKLKAKLGRQAEGPRTVFVPPDQASLFLGIEEKVQEYFNDVYLDPESGEITVAGERYVLFRSDSMSYEFMEFIKKRYENLPEQEAISIGNNFQYDNAKVIGKKDAIAFYKRLNLIDPIEKLSAGPIHFAFTGWANVEILPESNPVKDENFLLRFYHHNSFEAQSWIKAGVKSEIPVCTMNCGYSAGWCEESYGIPLTTVELTCEAQGAEHCSFVMAPSDKIDSYIENELDVEALKNVEIPVFFNRISQEQKLVESLNQKEMLIQEIHHRVKNNLQVIVSLLKLQVDKQANQEFSKEFNMTINRVNTMAAVHELLYQQKNFDRIEIESYFTELIKSFILFYTVDQNVDVEIKIEVDDSTIGLDKSIPLALIMNEITCNAYKHALNDKGKFYLKLSKFDSNLILEMGDDGPGIAENSSNEGLGTSLIEILCEQLDAQLEILNSDSGLHYKITIPLD